MDATDTFLDGTSEQHEALASFPAALELESAATTTDVIAAYLSQEEEKVRQYTTLRVASHTKSTSRTSRLGMQTWGQLAVSCPWLQL